MIRLLPSFKNTTLTMKSFVMIMNNHLLNKQNSCKSKCIYTQIKRQVEFEKKWSTKTSTSNDFFFWQTRLENTRRENFRIKWNKHKRFENIRFWKKANETYTKNSWLIKCEAFGRKTNSWNDKKYILLIQNESNH